MIKRGKHEHTDKESKDKETHKQRDKQADSKTICMKIVIQKIREHVTKTFF